LYISSLLYLHVILKLLFSVGNIHCLLMVIQGHDGCKEIYTARADSPTGMLVFYPCLCQWNRTHCKTLL